MGFAREPLCLRFVYLQMRWPKPSDCVGHGELGLHPPETSQLQHFPQTVLSVPASSDRGEPLDHEVVHPVFRAFVT